MSSTDQFSWGLFWEELLLDRGSDIVALHFGFLEGRPTLQPNLAFSGGSRYWLVTYWFAAEKLLCGLTDSH